KRIEALCSKYETILNESSILEWNANQWKDSAINLELSNEKWLTRELQWHSYYLRSAGYFDEAFQAHKYPQGSIYAFGHGFDGAIRDYVFFLYPLIFLSPELAREFITYILKLMQPNGILPYAVYGHGKTVGALVHSRPSDLPIFILWGILEYVTLTQDFQFLTETIPFYGHDAGTSTVLERINLLIEFLFSSRVGLGPHGLIKVNDGDWSDGISLMVKKRRKFLKKGESLFNTALAIYVLSRYVPILKKIGSGLAIRVEKNVQDLKKACYSSWNGRWFYRGWDGNGAPIGDKEIFLEHHALLLVANFLSSNEITSIINEVHENLDNPSKIGQYLLYPPVKTWLNILPPGWDVNGGIWAIINYVLTWAYALHDPKKAWKSLWKNSMANRAIQYPHIWYGIWSGPDSYIAGHAERPGEAFYHFPTPMTDWPLMNLNLHSGILSSSIRMIGIEPDQEKLVITPRLKSEHFTFKIPLIDVIYESKKIEIVYRSPFWSILNLNVKIPEKWKETSDVKFNGRSTRAESSIFNGFLCVGCKREREKILHLEIFR
ncbi:MAG: GH36-type glycosyl hydrolase domain-containing protein, partial [Candidatus Helarchaeota archaeon]